MLQVVRIDAPYGDRVPKMPAQDWNYHRDLVGETRTDVKPLNVVQPEGPSFQVGWVSSEVNSQSLPMPVQPRKPMCRSLLWVGLGHDLRLASSVSGLFNVHSVRRSAVVGSSCKRSTD